MVTVNRGDIFMAQLEPVLGSEQGGRRPVLIIQNDNSNLHSPITIITPFTSKIFNKEFLTNVFVSKSISKLDKDSTILLNQIRSIDKSRLFAKLGRLNFDMMKRVDNAIKISLGLD
ncbi:MAG: type II toxin-antitoxin system PemK/MazF family toxin [Nanoarchaeota archaeon]